MFSSWSKLQFCYICNEAQWAKKKLKNGANFGYKWIHDYLKYYPLAFGVTLWKKDRSQKLTCQLGWNCPFPWNLSPLYQKKLNRASKQHILTTTRTLLCCREGNPSSLVCNLTRLSTADIVMQLHRKQKTMSSIRLLTLGKVKG